MTGNVSNAGCKLHLETGNTAGFVMIPRIQEYFGINPLVQTVTFNLHYATKVLAKLRRNIWVFPILNLKLD